MPRLTNVVEQDFITTLDMGFYSNCVAASACAVFMYDRFLTIEQEVRLGLGRGVGYILNIILNIAAAMFHISVGAISALRCYAINGRSLWTPAVIITLSLVGTALDIYKSSTTWKAAYGLKRSALQLGMAVPITTLILRDGE
ncbi:hypothetical protein DAEQUDRAFT_756578 [Daedalea quercina L-15889]|uniref:Uncharacterized protein n=1 Tax=Daedalea quercina L-15889 TaxID=1314783 RepID=A0A165R2H1_9APHY|nr:hypothetical protein DAEQUDRAFT_756578 [Daedalea quercina L-15889]